MEAHSDPKPEAATESADHTLDSSDVRSRFGRRVATIALAALVVGIALYIQRSVVPVLKGEAEAQGAQVLGLRPNGFNLSNLTLPKRKILHGGPDRDGIPSIDDPKFKPVSDVKFLRPGDLVAGFQWEGEAKAYPIKILLWHEIVNDTVGGRPIAMTYCPLCGTCMAFDRRYDGREMTFGVSGLLYESDVLLYDRQTESLWSQLKMESVSGPLVGTALNWLPSEQMTWQAWKERYPESVVLSNAQGFGRDYRRQPYSSYEDEEGTYFPVTLYREDLRNKEWIAGVVLEGQAKAYPLVELEKLGGEVLEDTVGGVPIRVLYDVDARWVKVERADSGTTIPYVRAYWFAWQAFYPETLVHKQP